MRKLLWILCFIVCSTAAYGIEALKIRPINYEDLTTISEMEPLVFDEPWGKVDFIRCLRAGYGGWVIIENNEILAYSLVCMSANQFHISRLAVDPFHQKKGYGRGLLQHIIQKAKQLNFTKVTLEVRENNLAAVNLYKKMGFVVIGKKRNYYTLRDGRKESALEMVFLMDSV